MAAHSRAGPFPSADGMPIQCDAMQYPRSALPWCSRYGFPDRPQGVPLVFTTLRQWGRFRPDLIQWVGAQRRERTRDMPDRTDGTDNMARPDEATAPIGSPVTRGFLDGPRRSTDCFPVIGYSRCD